MHFGGRLGVLVALFVLRLLRNGATRRKRRGSFGLRGGTTRRGRRGRGRRARRLRTRTRSRASRSDWIYDGRGPGRSSRSDGLNNRRRTRRTSRPHRLNNRRGSRGTSRPHRFNDWRRPRRTSRSDRFDNGRRPRRTSRSDGINNWRRRGRTRSGPHGASSRLRSRALRSRSNRGSGRNRLRPPRSISGRLSTPRRSLTRWGLTLGQTARVGVQVLVERVETFGSGTFEIEPPDTSENLLVENGSVRAEERPFLIGEALMPSLTTGLDVGVHARGSAVALEARVGWRVVNGVVDVGLTRHRIPEPGQRIVRVVTVTVTLTLSEVARVGFDGTRRSRPRPASRSRGRPRVNGDQRVIGHFVGVTLLLLTRDIPDETCKTKKTFS